MIYLLFETVDSVYSISISYHDFFTAPLATLSHPSGDNPGSSPDMYQKFPEVSIYTRRIVGFFHLTGVYYIPRAPMTSIFEGQPPPKKNKAVSNQNKGHLGSRCIYIYTERERESEREREILAVILLRSVIHVNSKTFKSCRASCAAAEK